MRHGTGTATTLLVSLLCLAPAAPVQDAAGGEHGAPPAEAALTGRDIYARVLENRFDSFIQDSTLRSGDRGGREQVTKLRMHWQDFRNGQGDPAKGVLSKTLVRYSHPFEVRHAVYLIIDNSRRPNDQFVYFPSRRQVVRVNLRSEAVFGTDFSFEDILPRELRDAEYRRFEDGEFRGIPTYTVEAIPTELADSEYSRFLIHVDQDRFVTLRARYWDEAGVEVKELRVNPAAIERIQEVWVPRELTMSNLRLESSTTLEVTKIRPNPELPPQTFTLRRLEAH